MRVLLTGANGYIGSHLAAALNAAGHEVVCAVRRPGADPRLRSYSAVPCDMARDVRPEAWRWKLDRIDATVNCAGILRATRRESFQAVHVDAPLALAQACAGAGIRRFVQISALGDPADGEFIASKHRFDTALAGLDLDWVVLRPSVVYSTQGSYGGSSLLRACAALPGVLLLPDGGGQRIQPLALEDLAQAVVAALQRGAAVRETIELGGPEPMTLAQYLRRWRMWLGFAPAREVALPLGLARFGALLGEVFGSGPLGTTLQRMLERGNVVADAAVARAPAALGLHPRTLEQALAAAPSQVQDRWHARLYFLAPLLRLALALLWLGSGIAGLKTSVATLDAWFGHTGLGTFTLAWLAFAGSVADLTLGALLLIRWRSPAILKAMFAITVAYTLFVGALAPRLWFEPLGSVLKNLVILPATLIAIVLADRR